MMLLVGGLSALISVNGAVAALLPVVVVLAVRLGRPTGQLLMPLVFAGHAGSMLLLTGSPVNVLISEELLAAEGRSFGYFEFALVGVPLLAGGIAIALVFGERLLPARSSAKLPPDLSRHARTLVEQYRLTGDLQALKVQRGSPLDGSPRRALDLSAGRGSSSSPSRGPTARRRCIATPLRRATSWWCAARPRRSARWPASSASASSRSRSTPAGWRRPSSTAARGWPRCWCRRARR
jgi:hypothetical protein